MAAPKKLYIKTYGCQMNVYDSERMAEAMGAEGYVATETPDDADMVLLNTCHIREKAAEKVYSDLGRLRPLKEAKPDLRIGVAGCVAQAEGQEILRRMPLVDLVVGPQSYHRLPALMRAADRGEKSVETDFPVEDKFEHLPDRPSPSQSPSRGPTAFLTVQEGCDKFCAFCVVPYTRGSEASRPAAPHPGRGARTGGQGRARNHPAGAERECLSRCGRGWGLGPCPADRRPCGSRRAGPAALYHLASQRHG